MKNRFLDFFSNQENLASTEDPPFLSRGGGLLFKAFYVLGFSVLLNLLPRILDAGNAAGSPEWFWPVAWASPWLNPTSIFGLAWAIPAAMVAVLFWGRWRIVRILGAVAWLVALSLAFPTQKIWNSVLLWPGVALIFAWPNADNEKQVRCSLWMAQAYALSSYFCSGLWKIRPLADCIREGTLKSTLEGTLTQAMAFGMAEGTGRSDVMLRIVQNFPSLSALLWVGVIVFQLSTFVPLLVPRWIPWWGVGLIAFHFGVVIGMGPIFEGQILLIGYLLFLAPILLPPAGKQT